jgi:hypothetical protein
MLRTIINKHTGQELRAQFDDFIGDDEMLIDALRTEEMENPYWDFDNEIFYNNPITNSLE